MPHPTWQPATKLDPDQIIPVVRAGWRPTEPRPESER